MYVLTPGQNMAGYNAALYIRLSKEDVHENGKGGSVTESGKGGSVMESGSIANQRSILREFCTRHRIYIYDEYVDDGWSGGNYDRPSFQRMIADIESKRVNLVITKDMSRLGRDYIDTGHYIERYFPVNGVRYISLLDGVDTGLELSANDMSPFRALFNDFYAKDISKKIKSVKRDKQNKGLFIGWKPPYGYKVAPGNVNRLILDENAAVVVREIFDMALSGISCRQIAVSLNERGIQTPAQYANLRLGKKGPYSGLWSSEKVTSTLKNRIYTGAMVQRRMEKVSYKSKICKRLPEEQWVIVENMHEPIVSKEDYEIVLRSISSRSRTRRRTYDYPLKGLVYCKECQAPLGVINRVLSGNRPALYFICRTYQRFTKSGVCTSHCIRAERIMDVVISRIRKICLEYLDRKTCEQVAEALMADMSSFGKAEAEIKRLTWEMGNLTSKMDKLYDDRLSGIVEDSDFLRRYNTMKTARSNIREQLDKLAATEDEQPLFSQDIDETLRRFIASADTNRELLCSLIERVEMSDGKELTVRFRFALEENVHLH